MVCTPISGPGFTGFVCSRGRGAAKKCSAPNCGRKATKLCDFKIGEKTCDRDLCAAHAVKPRSDHLAKLVDTDYCGPHARILGLLDMPAVRR